MCQSRHILLFSLGKYFDVFVRSLDEGHACCGTFLAHLFWPNGGLDFAYVGLVEEHHAEAALTDSTTNGEWHFVVE